MRWPFVSRAAFEILTWNRDRLAWELDAADRRYEKLLDEVLRRGLKDEKEPTHLPSDDKPLPNVIARALSQWPEGSAPYVQNRNYAFAQMLVRPDDAEGIAAEISQGEDVESYA